MMAREIAGTLARAVCTAIMLCLGVVVAQPVVTRDVVFDPGVPEPIAVREYEPIVLTLRSSWLWLNRVDIAPPQPTGPGRLTALFNADNMISSFGEAGVAQTVRLDGVPAGLYRLEVGLSGSTQRDVRTLAVTPSAPRVTINTYCENGHADCVLDTAPRPTGPAYGGRWDVLSDSSFLAWPAEGVAPANAIAVTRLRSPGNKAAARYFFTADAGERQQLVSAGFVDEGVAFRILLPDAGACPASTRPIYRTYLQDNVGGPSHRYTADVTAYRMLAKSGGCARDAASRCLREGVAFCAPTQEDTSQTATALR